MLLYSNPMEIRRNGSLSTLCHSCGFSRPEGEKSASWPGLDYLRSEDGVVYDMSW